MKGIRGSGGKRVVRYNASLSNQDSFKINRLSTACQLPPTTLVAIAVHEFLNNAEMIEKLQKEYCLYNAYRVYPIKNFQTGELDFYLGEDLKNRRDDL